MTYKLGNTSRERLEGIHPDLIKVVERAIEVSKQDFSVLEGVRTAARQNALFLQGRVIPGPVVTYKDGYKKKSNHQVKSDGYGHAVDLIPYPVDWKTIPKFQAIATAMKQAAQELKVKLVWGGDWKMKDYPHFELGE